jgi:hypothetical protein
MLGLIESFPQWKTFPALFTDSIEIVDLDFNAAGRPPRRAARLRLRRVFYDEISTFSRDEEVEG